MDADDLRDYEDQLPSIQPTFPADLGPYARFLQSMPDYLDMTQEEFTWAVDTLLQPSSGPPPPDKPERPRRLRRCVQVEPEQRVDLRRRRAGSPARPGPSEDDASRPGGIAHRDRTSLVVARARLSEAGPDRGRTWQTRRPGPAPAPSGHQGCQCTVTQTVPTVTAQNAAATWHLCAYA
jgi:hypothetical protein